jgi:uncharacterized protein (DUF1800 family)
MDEKAASFRPGGSLDVATALEPFRGRFDERAAAHLLRRAGFGGSPDEIRRLASGPMAAAVDALTSFPSTDPLPSAPDGLPDETPPPPGSMLTTELRVQRRREERAGVIAAQTWWLDRMLATQAPLQEKMTLFWHGHFTSAAIGKGVSVHEIVAQNALFRRFALGDVRALTRSVSYDPAMLKYLDNLRNDRSHPNENYARELMELFTLGIGNYSESDVREAARAWTGIRIRRDTGEPYLSPRLHDDGSKTFLNRTGNFDGDDIVDIIFRQPAAARFFAAKLLNFFVYNDPEPELIEATAALLRANSFVLAPVMSTLLRSNVFYSARAYRALVKSPVEFVVGTYRLFGVGQSTPETLGALRRMGQVLFYPPNVKGWPGGSTWLNSSTVLARENFANSVMTSKNVDASSWLLASGPGDSAAAARNLVDNVLQGDASPAATARLESYLRGDGAAALAELSVENFDQRMRGGAYLAMAMPAYQLA